MKNIEKKTWISTVVVGIALMTACLFIYNILKADTVVKVFTCLCNSSFASGLLMLCVGLVTWCSNQGVFVGLKYGFKQIFEKRRFEKGFSEREKYGEYREKQLKKQSPFLHMIIVGGALILLSIVFLLFI